MTISFVTDLSKQFREDFSHEPLKGILFFDKIDWMTPSSPKEPCNAMKTKSCAFKSCKIKSIESESRTNIEVL